MGGARDCLAPDAVGRAGAGWRVPPSRSVGRRRRVPAGGRREMRALLAGAADRAVGAGAFERARDGAADIPEDSAHFAARASSCQRAGTSGKSCRCTEANSPKRDVQASSAVNTSTGRKPRGQAALQMVEHAARGAAAEAVRPVAIQRVLAHVEIERRQVGGAERVDGGVDAAPGVAFHRPAQLRVQLPDAVQHEPLQLRHLRFRQDLRLREPSQTAEQPAQRVAQPAIQFRGLLEDLRADALVLGDVGVHHPEPQDVGAVLVFDFLRRDGVAERLGHLAALLVHGEAVREHRLERRTAARADRFEQRRMEPAAMLIRALQIKVGGPRHVPGFKDKSVGRAALEPHVDDVFTCS